LSNGGRIKKSDVDAVRDRTDIVQLISEFIPLKKTGREFRGPCPFHQEKDPSFYVNPAKGVYYCHGCKASGGAFQFVMAHEGLSFNEAVERLADRIGYRVSYESMSPGETRAQSLKERLYRLNQTAADYYQHVLKETPEGKTALEYLTSRGLDRSTVDEFHLGFAPGAWSAVGPFLSKKGFSEAEIVTAGLGRQREGGQKGARGIYDVFRNRVVFPILDHRGRVVAFGGRIMPGASSDQPKYLNSPETPIYKKGHTLYGLYQARAAVQDTEEAIVVEGYTDLLALVQAGIKSVVATLGTALTEYHFDLLHRFCERVYLAFDADRAGRDAALRPLEFFARFGMDVLVVSLPEGQDPASLVEGDGAEQFTALLQKAETLPDFAARQAIQKCDTSTVMGRRKAMQSCVPVLAQISGEDMRPVRNDLVRKIGGWLDMPRETVDFYMREALRVSSRGTRAGAGPAMGMGDKVEREALRLLLHDPDALLENQYLDADYFTDENNKKIFEMLKDISGSDEEDLHAGYDTIIGRFIEGIEDNALRARVTKLSMETPPECDPVYSDKVFDRLSYVFYKRQMAQLELQIKSVDKRLEPKKYDALCDQLLDLDRLIKEQFPYDHR
jgi:DNA primase